LDKLPIVAGDYLDQIRLSLSAAFRTRSATLKQTYWYPYRAVLYDSLARVYAYPNESCYGYVRSFTVGE